MAQNSAPPPMVNPVGTELNAASSVDQILDALDARGKGLNSFTADVSLSETDPSVGDTTMRSGKTVYQLKSNGDGRIRVTFDTLDRGGHAVRETQIYMLDNGVLIDRNYRTKSQTTRQVRQPGEKIDLFDLGSGAFPLPVGQSQDKVYKQFDVKKLDSTKDDPPGTVHIQLIPKPDTRFARQFKSIDVWVESKSHMPRRIATMDSTQTTMRTTDLQNIQVNPKVSDGDFTLEKIDTKNWNLVEEKFQD
jgi:outer membrane lipoprotein-sorting protein